MSMGRETMAQWVEKWNKSVDRFMEDELIPYVLAETGIGAKDGMIPLNACLKVQAKAQEFLREKNLQGAAAFLQKLMRQEGYDVRMDMNTYKLVLY